jgi:alanine-glyoxylate transaminase/serine-glyoxylate transaminase/serine-pyruvate transaminase
MAAPTIDHRGPEFAALARGVASLAGTSRPVALYPSSGTGAPEASLVNTLSAGDRVLAYETGHFALRWAAMAAQLGIEVDLVPGDWRTGADPEQVFDRLSHDAAHAVKAVTVVRNETSTGTVSRIAEIRAAIDAAEHPALLIVDAISSLGSIEYRHDEWRAGVTVWCSQKGMMLPAGLGLNVISAKALDAGRVREIVLDRYNASLGAGLGRLAGRAFRIGHLVDLGDLMLAGTLCGVEMGLAQAGMPIERTGVRAALDYLQLP